MKNIKLFSVAVFTLLCFAVLPLQAYHLDGLWRNDRQNITIRIERAEDGFRAKRIDQGIWYNYVTKDGYQFLDRFGNAYTLNSDQEIVWHEAGSGKKLFFSKIEGRDDDKWEHKKNRNDNGHHYGNRGRPGWNESRNHLDGRWRDSFNEDELYIEYFKDGIRVRGDHTGWQKFYPGQYGHIFKDKYGNTIQLMGDDTIRWENRNGRHDRIYYRASGYRHKNGW